VTSFGGVPARSAVSGHSAIRHRMQQAKNWQNDTMPLHWTVAAFEASSKGYRRIMGYEHHWILKFMTTPDHFHFVQSLRWPRKLILKSWKYTGNGCISRDQFRMVIPPLCLVPRRCRDVLQRQPMKHLLFVDPFMWDDVFQSSSLTRHR